MAGGARSDNGLPCRRRYDTSLGPGGCLGGAVSGVAGGFRGMHLASIQEIYSPIIGSLLVPSKMATEKKGNYNRSVVSSRDYGVKY